MERDIETPSPLAPEDCGQISVDRRKLLEELDRYAQEVGENPPAIFVAWIRCGPIETMRAMANSGEAYSFLTAGLAKDSLKKFVYMWQEVSCEPVNTELEVVTGLTAASEAGDSPSPAKKPRKESDILTTRHVEAEKQLKRKGSYHCCLTQGSLGEATHIWPKCLMDKAPDADRAGTGSLSGEDMWKVMACFFTTAKKREYQEEFARVVQGKHGADAYKECENYIILQHHLQIAWATGNISLKPIGDWNDKHTLQLQLIFSGAEDQKLAFWTPISWLHSFENTENVDHVMGKDNAPLFAYSWKAHRLLRNGDTITITTPDADQYPLPSRTLLELKYFMNRAFSFCARALDEDEISDPEDEEDVDPVYTGLPVPSISWSTP